MFKLKFIPLFLLFSGACYAEYQLYYPLGNTVDIKFVSGEKTSQPVAENWIAYDPFYSDWMSYGEPYNCTEWSPSASLYHTDESVTQTATCDQEQRRTIQNREINTINNDIRNAGDLIEESTSISVEETRVVNGESNIQSYTIQVGLANSRHYGFTSDKLRSYYSLVLNHPSSITPNLYKNVVIDGLYYNDTQGIALAVDKSLPNTITPPTIIVNGASCKPTSIIYENANWDAYYYNNCSFNSVFNSNVGKSIIVKIE